MSQYANRNVSVLVVEDDKGMSAVIGQILRTAGYSKVVALSDAKSAIEHMKHNKLNLLLLDNNLPDIEGVELLKKIRKRNKDIPIVVVSGLNDQETIIRAVKAGANHFIAKPFETDHLITTLDQLLKANEHNPATRIVCVDI